MKDTSWQRAAFCVFNYAFIILLMILCVYPLWYIFIQSISPSSVSGGSFLLPRQATFENYLDVFQLEGVPQAFGVSVARTVVGTSLTTVSCMLLGYLFSKEEMAFRKTLYRLLTVTMYVSGGLIPGYLAMKSYGLLNTFWVYILPSTVSAYYVILIKTYVEQLPASIEESAKIDGAGTLRIFASLIFPLSLPIVATIAVYASVAQWNSWMDNHIYAFSNEKLKTLQYLLYQFLQEAERLAKAIQASSGQIDAASILSPRGVRMTITIITVVPVILVYPFMQRFFVKGILIGAVKG